jgi:SAM-dependent methyltransferase
LTDKKERYWEGVAKDWLQNRPSRLWRVHGDVINGMLLVRWLPTEEVGWLLKTDLFDELVSEGLYPILAPRARQVLCIDISLSTLYAVQGRLKSPQKTGADVRSLPFVDNIFDIIVSNSTLDHFISPDEIHVSMRELYRVLRPGGVMILTLDNLANPAIALRNRLPFRLLHRLGIVPYYVGVTLRPDSLQALLQEVGFHVLEVDTIMHCPRVLAVALAGWIESHSGPKTQRRFLHALKGFECLSHWPTRFLTGNFIAVKAAKRLTANE